MANVMISPQRNSSLPPIPKPAFPSTKIIIDSFPFSLLLQYRLTHLWAVRSTSATVPSMLSVLNEPGLGLSGAGVLAGLVVAALSTLLAPCLECRLYTAYLDAVVLELAALGARELGAGKLFIVSISHGC